MKTLFLQMGIFNIALTLVMFVRVREDRKNNRDCLLFSRSLMAIVAILAVDTIGWVIDGAPLFGQLWITELIDALDLFFTTLVCWCWVKYAMCIVNRYGYLNRKWFLDFANVLLLFQAILVGTNNFTHIYFFLTPSGEYIRGHGYVFHALISLLLLSYSSIWCIFAFVKEKSKTKRKELLFVAFIILVPVLEMYFNFTYMDILQFGCAWYLWF